MATPTNHASDDFPSDYSIQQAGGKIKRFRDQVPEQFRSDAPDDAVRHRVIPRGTGYQSELRVWAIETLDEDYCAVAVPTQFERCGPEIRVGSYAGSVVDILSRLEQLGLVEETHHWVDDDDSHEVSYTRYTLTDGRWLATVYHDLPSLAAIEAVEGEAV